MSIITLLTDFGSKDHYVGVMKGVILDINPRAKIVDISHEVSPQNVVESAIILKNSYSYFPHGAIHVAVVDPGVGTKRKALLVSGGGYFFVGPDNGIFDLIREQVTDFKVFELNNPRFFLETVSATFHGRDVFAPVAAYLSKGVPPLTLGRAIKTRRKLSLPKPILEKKQIKGTIIYIDGFGNLVTNINPGHLKSRRKGKSFKVKIRKKIIPAISAHYQEVEKGDILCLIGSSGLLEISAREANARSLLKVKEGAEVVVFF